MSDSTDRSQTARTRTHALALGAWLLLLTLVWWRQLSQGVNWAQLAWALVYSVPLLAPLHGLWRRKRYTHRWATLCVLPYFVVGATEAVANVNDRGWATALFGASLLWFFALIGFLRVTRAATS